MTTEEAIETIEHHQRWRTGEDMPLIHPKKLTEALNELLFTAKSVILLKKCIEDGTMPDDFQKQLDKLKFITYSQS